MRIYKQSLLALSLLASVSGQAQVFSESFTASATNSPMPNGWTIFDVDGQTPFANVSAFSDAWSQLEDVLVAGNGCAYSNSWYDPQGQSDDWTFTPAITLPASGNIVLTWKGMSVDADYLESYEVRILTVAPTSGNLTSSTLLQTVTDEGSSWTPHSQSLNAYLGQTVYIGFRNISTDKYLLGLDDVRVDAASTDASLTMAEAGRLSFTTNQYERYPYVMLPTAQIPALGGILGKATITNTGSTAIAAPMMSVSLWDGSNMMVGSAATGTGTALTGTGASVAVTSTSIAWPSAVDNYTLRFLNTTSGDATATNDTSFVRFAVTDSVLAREMGDATGSLAIGANEVGFLGLNFPIDRSDTLTSVSFYLNAGFTGSKLAMQIYSTNANGSPNALLWTSDTLMNDTTTGWKHFSANMNVTSGMNYFVAAVEFDSALTLGTNRNYFYPANTWLFWPSSPAAPNWSNFEDFNFNVTPMIRMNFASMPVGVQETAPAAGFEVFPNPNNGIFTVKMDMNRAADASIAISNVEGKIVYTQQLGVQTAIQQPIDLSRMPAGVYFVQVRTEGHTYQQRIVKQ